MLNNIAEQSAGVNLPDAEGIADLKVMRHMLDKVAVERARQRDLLRQGSISDDCADLMTDDDAVLRVLIEEIGEVARGVDQIKQMMRRWPRTAPIDGRLRRRVVELQKEYIQVAAVAVARAEALEKRLQP